MLSRTLRIRHRSLPPFLTPLKPLPIHLEIQMWAVNRPRNDDDSCLGRVETLTEYAVDERLDLFAPEFLDYPSAC